MQQLWAGFIRLHDNANLEVSDLVLVGVFSSRDDATAATSAAFDQSGKHNWPHAELGVTSVNADEPAFRWLDEDLDVFRTA